MPAPLVSVIVPVLDDATRLAACLDALHRQVGAPAFEVVVVDNGSTDTSVAVARTHPVGAVVLHEPRRGSYAARNAGIARARGSQVAFTDADCVPAPDWLAAGSAALGSAAAVGGEVQPQRSQNPTVWERYDTAVYLRQHDLVTRQGFAATANLWVRRELLEVRFDPALRSSGDLEWTRRAGVVPAFAGEVVVGHAPRRDAVGTWRLHRRLGAGWRVLSGRYPELRAGLWLPLGLVVDQVAADGPPLRRRQLGPVHSLAMAARREGWLRARAAAP